MNANEIRESATREFMTGGLGGVLTRRVAKIMAARQGRSSPMDTYTAINLVFGNIIERTLWIGLGRWIGFLRATVVISEDEREFFMKNSKVIREDLWPSLFTEVMESIRSTQIGEIDSSDPLIASELPQSDNDIFPLFQAATILAEDLDDELINSFFIFLRQGYPDNSAKQSMDANSVFQYLERRGNRHIRTRGYGLDEAVIAGFVRYTEFLSAMDNLFPEARRGDDGAPTYNFRVIDIREQLANEIANVIKWRFPRGERALELYEVVKNSFFQMVSSQFEQHPRLGLQWSEEYSRLQIDTLSERFFGIDDWREETNEAREVPRPTSPDFIQRPSRKITLEGEESEMIGDIQSFREVESTENEIEFGDDKDEDEDEDEEEAHS